jgi:hypothetical protein
LQQLEKAEPYILKSGDIIVTISQFTEELELKKSGYNYNIKDNPSEYNDIIVQLIQDLSEDIVLLHLAKEKNIVVSDQEFKKAEQNFLKDYPDDTFNKLLLKNAVDYSFWRKKFKKRLIIDKLIQKELREKIVINTEDVVQFYDKCKKESKHEINENDLIAQLREEKTEEKYSDWIDKAMIKYPVVINEKELKKIFIGLEKSRQN